MSGTFNSANNPTPVEPSGKVQQQKDIMDAPITPMPAEPLKPKPDDAEHPILASSNDGSADAKDSNDAQDPNSQAFKPQVFRRQSSNYEDAARAATNSFKSSGESGGPPVNSAIKDLMGGAEATTTSQKGPENPASDWQPRVQRQQSFERQDWKHDLQQAAVGGEKRDEDNTGLGFTEAGSPTHNKRYSQS